MGIEQNPNQIRTHIFSQTNKTEQTKPNEPELFWKTELEPNCQTGRTEQNPNLISGFDSHL